jgi:hypothetical protein
MARPTSKPPSLSLLSDAAVISAANGEVFARWFERTGMGQDWREFTGVIPISRVYEIADEARRRAAAWLEFASSVEGRVSTRQPQRVCL